MGDVVSLFPQEDPITPEDDLSASSASVLDSPLAEVPAESPVPFGRSWAMDWSTGRFIRAGGSPLETRGLDTLVQWLQLARLTQRGAHDAFSEDFGMDRPDGWMATVDVLEATSDYGVRLADAWLLHDRVASVENFEAYFDSTEGVIIIDTLDVITDTEDSVPMTGPAPLYPE